MLSIVLLSFQPRRSRSGMSTVLGMLIFIGVLFTCVIPLFLYVNSVNTIYNQEVLVMRNFDTDREMELITPYAHPCEQSGSTVSVYVKNKCPFSVEIVMIWINDQKFSCSLLIPGMGYGTTIPIDISGMLPTQSGETEHFNIKVTTTRGNTVSSLTNPLIYTKETTGGSWSGGSGFAINIIIEGKFMQKYNIKVCDASDPTKVYHNEDVWLFLETNYFKKVDIPPEERSYAVTITRLKPTGWSYTETIDVDWEHTSHWIYATDPDARK